MGALNSEWSSISVRGLMGLGVKNNPFYKYSRVIEHTIVILARWWVNTQNPQAIVWITGDISKISFSVIGDIVAIPYECVLEKKLKEKKSECVDPFY